MAMLFEIHPTCKICGKELVKVVSGLVCIEGHGKILPVEEFEDINDMPTNHSDCERLGQMTTKQAVRQFSAAQTKLRRLEKAKAKAKAKGGA